MTEREAIELTEKLGRGARLPALVRYWRDKRGARPMVFRADIDPLEIPRLLPLVLIADRLPEGARMRLMGSEATAAVGFETRGRMVADIDLGEFTPAWRAAFAAAAESREPIEASGTIKRLGVANRVDLVLMPLTHGSGSIDQIFGGLVIKSILQYAVRSHNAPITAIPETASRSADTFASATNDPGRAHGGRRID